MSGVVDSHGKYVVQAISLIAPSYIIQIAIYPGSKLSSLDYTPYAHTTIQLHDRLNAQRS